MVGAAFLVDFVAVGFFFYSYGVFFKAIAGEFGDSRLGVALGLTVTSAVGAIAAPLVGRALDRFPLRKVIGLGALSMAVGFLLLSQVQTQWQFYLVLGLFIGFGASSMGNLATAKLVTNWFDRRRGMALGIAATGVSFSGVVMPFVSAELILAYGWRQGFLLFGLFTLLVMVPLVLRFVISRPEDVGLQPDGALPAVEKDPAAKVPMEKDPVEKTPLAEVPDEVETLHPNARALLANRNFWSIALTFGLAFCAMSTTLTHMVPRITDLGHSLSTASLVMSLCAGLGVFGKLWFGWLSDRLRVRNVLRLVLLLQFCGQLTMYLNDSLLPFALGAALFGFGVGGVVPLQSSLVGKTFGRQRFGAVSGLLRPAMFPIQILGVPFAGWVFDTTGSYALAFEILLGVYVLAAGTLMLYNAPAKPVK